MELRPNQNHRVPVFAPLRLEGVEQEYSAGAFLVASWLFPPLGRGRATQAEPQADTGRNGGNGGMQNLYHFNSRQQNTTLWRRR